jgi:hypothetical protein
VSGNALLKEAAPRKILDNGPYPLPETVEGRTGALVTILNSSHQGAFNVALGKLRNPRGEALADNATVMVVLPRASKCTLENGSRVY